VASGGRVEVDCIRSGPGATALTEVGPRLTRVQQRHPDRSATQEFALHPQDHKVAWRDGAQGYGWQRLQGIIGAEAQEEEAGMAQPDKI
jgi:hypothetical protein